MFLSTYENKLDKKGRVSVPASFRSYLSNLGYNGVICYPSFNNLSIEAWPQDRIEKISNTIDSLNPFEEKRDFFAKNSMIFVGQGKTFQIWEPTIFEKFRANARKKANSNRSSLKWESQLNK